MSAEQILILAVAAFFIGIAKAGFSGISLISVFLLTETFGAKQQIGVALPMLIIADLIVYPAFRKHGSWRPVWGFLWPTLIGIGVAMWILEAFSEQSMRTLIGVIILCMVAMQVWRKRQPSRVATLAHSRGFGLVAGVFGGLATMLANAAGPILQLYLLSKNMSKMDLIGVGARFFLVVNLLKLPLSAGLSLTTLESLKWSLAMTPVVACAIFIGKFLLLRISQTWFERMVVFFAFVAGIRLLT